MKQNNSGRVHLCLKDLFLFYIFNLLNNVPIN